MFTGPCHSQTAHSGESNSTVALLFFSSSVVFNSIGMNPGPFREEKGVTGAAGRPFELDLEPD